MNDYLLMRAEEARLASAAHWAAEAKAASREAAAAWAAAFSMPDGMEQDRWIQKAAAAERRLANAERRSR